MHSDEVTTALKWTCLAPGYYEATTGPGELDRYEAVRITNEYGGDTYTQWFLTYPGETNPDDVFDLLRDAKAAAAGFVR